MKYLVFLLAISSLALAGCHGEEPAEPLSPEAQQALKTGNTGMPPEAKAASQGSLSGGENSRGADMKPGNK